MSSRSSTTGDHSLQALLAEVAKHANAEQQQMLSCLSCATSRTTPGLRIGSDCSGACCVEATLQQAVALESGCQPLPGQALVSSSVPVADLACCLCCINMALHGQQPVLPAHMDSTESPLQHADGCLHN